MFKDQDTKREYEQTLFKGLNNSVFNHKLEFVRFKFNQTQ